HAMTPQVTSKDGKYIINGQSYKQVRELGKGGQAAANLIEREKQDEKDKKDEKASHPEQLVIKHTNQKEVAMHAQVGVHPNVAKFVAGSATSELSAVVMEHLGGGTLAELLDQLRDAYEEDVDWLKTGRKRLTQDEYWGVLQYLIRSILEGVKH